VTRGLGNPSWKVIVSASRGQYLKPDSKESGFFSYCFRIVIVLYETCCTALIVR
jgi:hypothetical protein